MIKIPDFIKTHSKTKIVATIGPVSEDEDVVRKMLKAGLSVARINLSHGTASEHKKRIATIRSVAKELGMHVGILLDLPGPKYRLCEVEGGFKSMSLGDKLTLFENSSTQRDAYFRYRPQGLVNDVKVGSTIMVDDGSLTMRVEAVDSVIHAVVTKKGKIGSGKTLTGIACPVSLDYLTEETVLGIKLAQEQKADFLGLSCLSSVKDVFKVREFLEDGFKPKLVAKFERLAALENLDQIIAESDAVMVARGDLGIEIDLPAVPKVQKLIIKRANALGKPCITATQMLETMVKLNRPTRAEIADIYNAVLDGSDALMLSGETAVGKFPVESIKTMHLAIIEAEKDLDLDEFASRRLAELDTKVSTNEAIAYGAINISKNVGAKLIVAFTRSGATAERISHFRSDVPILAACHGGKQVSLNIALSWGVVSLGWPAEPAIDELFRVASKIAIENGYATEGELIVVVAGTPVGVEGNTNLVRVIKVPEP